MSASRAGTTTLLELSLDGSAEEGLRVGALDKVDLLQYLGFDVDRLEANVKQVNHNANVMRVSAKAGEGVDEFRAGLKARPARIAAEAHDHDHDHADRDHAEQQPATA